MAASEAKVAADKIAKEAKVAADKIAKVAKREARWAKQEADRQAKKDWDTNLEALKQRPVGKHLEVLVSLLTHRVGHPHNTKALGQSAKWRLRSKYR